MILTGWINVKKTLPPQGVRVLLWCENHCPHEFIGFLRGNLDGPVFSEYETLRDIETVAYWMTMPPEPERGYSASDDTGKGSK